MDVLDLLVNEKMYNLAWVSCFVQATAWVLKWKLKDRFNGALRFATIYGVTTILGTIVLIYSGVSFKEAFAMANWLAQAQVAAHQAYKTSRRK